MSRVLALVVAVALVTGALYVRGRLDAGEPIVGVGGGEGGGGSPDDDTPYILVCAAELAAACEALAVDGVVVRVEDAGSTAAGLAGASAAGELGFDGWLAPQPWPGVAEALREPTLPALAPAVTSDVLARSPLVLAGFEERVTALEAACGRALDWRCLGDQAGLPWADLGVDGATGTVRPGHLDPTVSATGLLVLGQAVTSYADRTDLSRADLDGGEFAGWFDRLEGAVPAFDPSSGSQLVELQTRYLASYDAVGTTEAEVADRPFTTPAGRQPIVVRWPEPVATADVVVAGYTGDALPADLVEALGPALAGAGWRVDGSAPAGLDGAPALPGSAGLPGAGFLVALQQRWEEVT